MLQKKGAYVRVAPDTALDFLRAGLAPVVNCANAGTSKKSHSATFSLTILVLNLETDMDAD